MCGVGDNSTCLGCDGLVNSNAVLDDCGVCGGPGGCSGFLFIFEPLFKEGCAGGYAVAFPRTVCNDDQFSLQWTAPRNHSAFSLLLTPFPSTQHRPYIECNVSESLSVSLETSGRGACRFIWDAASPWTVETSTDGERCVCRKADLGRVSAGRFVVTLVRQAAGENSTRVCCFFV